MSALVFTSMLPNDSVELLTKHRNANPSLLGMIRESSTQNGMLTLVCYDNMDGRKYNNYRYAFLNGKWMVAHSRGDIEMCRISMRIIQPGTNKLEVDQLISLINDTHSIAPLGLLLPALNLRSRYSGYARYRIHSQSEVDCPMGPEEEKVDDPFDIPNQ
jgi:hypothetical protein